ncbi:protein O-glucosyltransferase 2 isoform X5 [Pristis pectinata]|uniref:protein O-glucosyltransferase 2 isoform X5 n=1 Tax=Pristis pectinata TaxID=685728 RepID=UPI00223E493E|nr:protein O-glucosyltransferase 2 isoform X5 [Pristis pectinata]
MPERWLFCILFVTITSRAIESTAKVSPKRSLVWGPGLDANKVLPARYFYIQAVAEDNVNFTSSPGENTFTVNINSPGEEFTRIWVQVLDRKDGSFLVRYRMYSSYRDLVIEIKFQDAHVAQSPYFLKGHVYHESCNCPQEDGTKWYKDMQCLLSFPQIQRDLAHFPFVDPERNAIEIAKRFGQRQSLCHYTIKDNKVYVKTFGEHVGFRIFMDSILLSLTRKVKLQDVEFFVNLGDWPLEKRKMTEKLHPIFSWCGSENTRDIVMPTYDITDSVLETMGRVSLDMMSVQANTGPSWENKNHTAFWRGRDSRRERLELVKLGIEHPDLIDAAFTNFFFFPHNESLYGPIVKHVSFFDFFQAKMIAKAGQEYARNNLMADHIFCYYFKLFQEYADLQVNEPKVRDGMDLVDHPKDDLFPCVCHRTKLSHVFRIFNLAFTSIICFLEMNFNPKSQEDNRTTGLCKLLDSSVIASIFIQ